MKMTKKQAFTLLGVENDNQLSKVIGITRQCIGRWDPKQIPELQAYRIREMARKAS